MKLGFLTACLPQRRLTDIAADEYPFQPGSATGATTL